MKTLLLTPAYRAARHLPELVRRVSAVFPLERYLIVNDGSPDDTIATLERIGMRFLTYQSNRGKGSALQVGYAWARQEGYDAVISLDADLQHAPEDLPGILSQHSKCPDAIVIGSRFIDHRVMPLDRLLSNNLTSLIVSIFCRQRVRDSQSGYRLMPLAALPLVETRTMGYMYESETLLKLGALGAPIREAPVATIYEGAVSFINPVTDTLRFVKLIWRRLWY